MRQWFFGGAVLAAAVSWPGRADAQFGDGLPFTARGQSPANTGFDPPLNTDPTVPIPTGRAGSAGFYFSAEYVMLSQNRTIGDQTIAVRGIFDSSGLLTGTPGGFVGSGADALNTRNLGKTTWQPGFQLEIGYRFDDGTRLFANYMHLFDAHYSAGASLAAPGAAGGAGLADTFISSPVFNFTPQYSGPAQKLVQDLPGVGSRTITQTVVQGSTIVTQNAGTNLPIIVTTPISNVRRSVQADATGPRTSSTRPPDPSVACGKNLPNAAKPTDATRTPDVTRCTTTGKCSADSSAPTEAPTTVPPLNAAWNLGITDRPVNRSMVAPSRFIPTSHTPIPMPARNSPTITTHLLSARSTPAPARPRPTNDVHKPNPTAAAAPNRWLILPEAGSPINDPADSASNVVPNCPGDNPSSRLTSGIREANAMNDSPARAKTVNTARRARSIGSGDVTRARYVPAVTSVARRQW